MVQNTVDSIEPSPCQALLVAEASVEVSVNQMVLGWDVSLGDSF
mgnify:CR=1 FL=1